MSQIIPTAEREPSPNKGKKPRRVPKKVYIPTIAGLIIVAIICTILLCNVQKTALDSATKQFDLAVSDARQEVYDAFYQTAFDIAEKRNHVANEILIDVNGIKESETLEVLDVSAFDIKVYKFDNELTKPSNIFLDMISFVTGNQTTAELSQAVVWLEGSCIGTYEIDLKASEVIVDNANNYVLVRLPSPSLKFISHDFEVKYFDNGTGILSKPLNGSTQQGLDAAIHDTADITAHLHDMLNNREQSDLAREQAIALITALVKNINHDNPQITVEVEFFS